MFGDKEEPAARRARRRPSEVPLYGFQPPVGTPYGLEVNTIEDFYAKHNPWPWKPQRPGRATFHYLMLVTEGKLHHDVDYVTQTVNAGQWLWVRPGHAQSWHPPGQTRGPFILFESDVLSSNVSPLLTQVTAHNAPAVLTPHPHDAQWLEQTAFQLLDEHRALGRRRLDVHHALRRTLLESLLIRLANSPDAGSAATSVLTTNELFGQFMDAVELRFRELHQADEYARMLGCSVRTLSRATRRGSGKGPRQIINERRLLEARRLLIRDHWDSRTVAEHLGFANAANFGRFFRTQHGTTPAAYAAKRDQQHGGTSNLDVPPLRPSI